MPLRAWRAAQEPKVSQQQLALKAGLSPSRYWQIESGEGVEPTTKERDAVANALSLKVSDIAWPDYLRARSA